MAANPPSPPAHPLPLPHPTTPVDGIVDRLHKSDGTAFVRTEAFLP